MSYKEPTDEEQKLIFRIIDGYTPQLCDIEALHKLMYKRLLDAQSLRAWLRRRADGHEVDVTHLQECRETYGVLSEVRFQRRQAAKRRLMALYQIPEQDADLWECGVRIDKAAPCRDLMNPADAYYWDLYLSGNDLSFGDRYRLLEFIRRNRDRDDLDPLWKDYTAELERRQNTGTSGMIL